MTEGVLPVKHSAAVLNKPEFSKLITVETVTAVSARYYAGRSDPSKPGIFSLNARRMDVCPISVLQDAPHNKL